MPWIATAGNGWKRNVESGVNGAEIAAILQLKIQAPVHHRNAHLHHLQLVWQILCIRLHVACIKQTSFGLAQVLISYI